MSAAEGTGTPVPYLVAVPDPYDTLSPYHDWGPVLLSAADAAKALGLHGGLDDLVTTLDPTGRVASATTVSNGATVDADRDAGAGRPRPAVELVRHRLPLARPGAGARDARTRRSRLAGVVRGLTGVSLEAQAANGAWTTVGTVTPAD